MNKMGNKTLEIKFGNENTIVSIEGESYNFGNPFQIMNYRTFHKYRIPNKFGKAIDFQYNPRDNKIDSIELEVKRIELEVKRFCQKNSLDYIRPFEGQNPAMFTINLGNNYEVLIK